MTGYFACQICAIIQIPSRLVEVLFLILILSTAMLLGNEFSIGAFIHPALTRTDDERFLPAIQVFAALFGKVMPFWMVGTLGLHLIVLGLSWHWPSAGSILLIAAALLLACDHCLQCARSRTNQQSGKSMGSPSASTGLARTETALGPP